MASRSTTSKKASAAGTKLQSDSPRILRKAKVKSDVVIAPPDKPLEPTDASYDNLLTGLINIIEPLRELQQQAARAMAPSVHSLIRTQSRDVHEIEHTLDHLLDCACIPEGLALFKSLCRYYYTIDPLATADYVYIYRDMWDNESDPEQETAS